MFQSINCVSSLYLVLFQTDQTDSDEENQHIFLEKRQRALRKKRRKAPGTDSSTTHFGFGNAHLASRVVLPSETSSTFTQNLACIESSNTKHTFLLYVCLICVLKCFKSKMSKIADMTNKRLTKKLGNLANGLQASVPAIRRVKEKLDQDLQLRKIDLNAFKVSILHFCPSI